MVKLENIDLTGITEKQQLYKMFEEDAEFENALSMCDIQNAIEEFWDVVQVRLGLLQISLGVTANEVMGNYSKHLKKIENRPREKE